MTTLAAGSVALAACGVGGPEEGSSGEDYPTRDVRVIVPFGAGGPSSLATQVSADCLSEELDQTFVVENLPGGSGAIGMTELTGSEPDGYTLGVGTIGNLAIGPLVNEQSQYTSDDVATIGKMYEIPSVVAVPDASPYATIEDLFAAAEATPNAVRVATPGATTMQATELRRLSDEHGITFNLVPFNGVAEAVTALLGGNADAMFLDISEGVQEIVDAGQARVLAVGTEERVAWLDGVPTLAELGYPELTNSTAFFSLVAPAGTPPNVIDTISGTLEGCLADSEVRGRLTERFVPKEFVGPEELAADIAAAQEVAEATLEETG